MKITPSQILHACKMGWFIYIYMYIYIRHSRRLIQSHAKTIDAVVSYSNWDHQLPLYYSANPRWWAVPWWRHQKETFSALLAFCAGEFPAQRPVTRSFRVFFDMRLNKLLSKQSWEWWFETLSLPLWRHCNALAADQTHATIKLHHDRSSSTSDIRENEVMLGYLMGLVLADFTHNL